MSILVDDSTKLLVQGITGREGAFHATRNKAYGTQVVAGVTPGKGGQEVDGIPVFDTVADAVEATGANTAMVFVPPRFAADAIYEAADSGVDLVVTITEGIPAHDMLRVYTHLRRGGQTLLGPNCPGVISPGVASVGIMPTQVFAPGRVGLVSRSGTLTYQISKELALLGIGQSTVVGIGGDPVVGSSFIDVLERFEADPETDLAVMVGEIGGAEEEKAAEFISERMRTPVVGYIAGFQAPPASRWATPARSSPAPRARPRPRRTPSRPGACGWAPTPPRWPRSRGMSWPRADRGEGSGLERVREVEDLLDEWAALADRVAAPAPLEPGYLAAWAEAYSATERLIAVTARRDGELAAVLPIVLDRSGLSTIALRYVDEVGLVCDGPASADAAMAGALSLPIARLLLRPVPEEGPPTGPWPPRPRGPDSR